MSSRGVNEERLDWKARVRYVQSTTVGTQVTLCPNITQCTGVNSNERVSRQKDRQSDRQRHMQLHWKLN